MSDQQPPVPPVGQDPRAAAKAAKAYAKAVRPWYKKKRWILTLAVVAIFGIAAATSDGSGGEVQASEAQTPEGQSVSEEPVGTKADEKEPEEAKPEKNSQVGTKSNPAPLGTAVRNKSAKYQIHGVTTSDTVGPAGLKETAAGTFVIVDLSVTNVKDKTIQFSTNDVVLQVSGTEIEPDSAGFYLDDAFSFDDISPGLTKRGKVLFDVAPKDAGKGVIKAQAIFSLDEAVYLSLKK